MLLQRLFGFILIACGIVSCIICEEGSAGVFLIMLGILRILFKDEGEDHEKI